MFRNSALATFLVTASFSLVLFSGCAEKNADGTTKKKQRILPPSSGTHSELLLVMPDELWEGAPGEEFRALYLADVEGLPQAEAYFDASRVEPKDVNKILQKTKSILWVEKSDTSFVKMQKDLWARPQRIVRITAPSEKAVAKSIKESAKQLMAAFKEHDMSVIQGRLKKSAYAYTHENLKDIGIKKMLLHQGFDPTLDKKDPKIFATKTVKTIQYVMVSERPMTEGLVSVDVLLRTATALEKTILRAVMKDPICLLN